MSLATRRTFKVKGGVSQASRIRRKHCHHQYQHHRQHHHHQHQQHHHHHFHPHHRTFKLKGGVSAYNKAIIHRRQHPSYKGDGLHKKSPTTKNHMAYFPNNKFVQLNFFTAGALLSI